MNLQYKIFHNLLLTKALVQNPKKKEIISVDYHKYSGLRVSTYFFSYPLCLKLFLKLVGVLLN